MTATLTTIDAHLIALDETLHYAIDERDRPYIDRIRGVYFFDGNSRTCCCEFTPSYYLVHVYDQVLLSAAGEALDEEEKDRIRANYEFCGGDDIYVHCHEIEALIKRAGPYAYYHHGEEETTDYESDVDAFLEYFRSNAFV